MIRTALVVSWALWGILFSPANLLRAEEFARVLPVGELPEDARLGPLRTLRQSEFPFVPPQTTAEWDTRREAIRRRVMVAAGLWPMPPRPAPRAAIYGKIDRPEYTVEKVTLESYPGLYVTGNLYRPKGGDSPRPAVLTPHGHWPEGRFFDLGEEGVAEQIAMGAERFPIGGRHPIQARCVQLARMGCVVLVYDMLGYGDNLQIPGEVVHKLETPRTEMDSPAGWGLFSTQAELRMQSPLAIHTYNSLSALDFLASLPDVDPERLAVTGGSSGATQSLMLSAVDSRPKVHFPTVMVSTAMQGGCPCENACCLRVGIGNVDIAALFAPKPLGMASANDWTGQFHEKGFPELQQLYDLLGAGQNVSLARLTQFPHNYNAVSRTAMYHWMNEHLHLGEREPIAERDYEPLTPAEMHVWDDVHPQPPGGEQFEKDLLRKIAKINQQQIAALTPRDAASLDEFRKGIGGALETILAQEMPAAANAQLEVLQRIERGEFFEWRCLARNLEAREQLPTIVLRPKNYHGQAVLWLDGAGKSSLLDASGAPHADAARLLAAGRAVVAADLFMQGEFLTGDEALHQTRVIDNPRPIPAFTFGYNPTLFAERAGDVLTLVAATATSELAPTQIDALAQNGAGPWLAAARGVAGGAIRAAAIDTAGFRFCELRSWRDPAFLPGAVKYGDLPAMLALSAPQPLWIGGEPKPLTVVEAAYTAAGVIKNLHQQKQPSGDAVAWLLSWE